MMPNVKCSKLDVFCKYHFLVISFGQGFINFFLLDANVPQDFLGLDAKLMWMTALTIGAKTMVPALTKSENMNADVSQDLKDVIVRKKLLFVLGQGNQTHVKMVENAKITSHTTLATAYLGLLVKTVQQTWTIVQVTCAKMEERAETVLTNIHANVRLNSLESFVRLSLWLLIYTHRPPLANSMTASMVYVWTYPGLMTISASVLPVTQEKDVNILLV